MFKFLIVIPILSTEDKDGGWNVIEGDVEYINISHIRKVQKHSKPWGSVLSLTNGETLIVKEERDELFNEENVIG